MRKLALVAILLAVGSSVNLMAPPASVAATTIPARHFVLLGDSLTMQYSPAFRLFAYPNRVTARYWPGTNPVGARWDLWLQQAGRADVVVFEDYAGSCCDMGGYDYWLYVLKVQQLVNIAHANGARFLVANTPPPDLAPVKGIDGSVSLMAGDSSDGVHYTVNGAIAAGADLWSAVR